MPELITAFGEQSGDPLMEYLAVFAVQNLRAAHTAATGLATGFSALNLPANWTRLLLQYACEAVAPAR